MLRSGTLAFLCGAALPQLLPELPALREIGAATVLAVCLWRRVALRPLACFCIGLVWSVLYAQQRLDERLPEDFDGASAVLLGQVAGVPQRGGSGTRFEFRLTGFEERELGLRPGARVQLYWRGAPRLTPGETWRLQARLKKPRGFSNPHGMDYEGWLFQRGIAATGSVIGSRGNRLLAAAEGESVNRLRDALHWRFATLTQGVPRAGIVEALAIGITDGITAREWTVLSRTGTTHLVSISGLHISLVAGAAFAALRWLWSRSAACAARLAAPRLGALAALTAAAAYAALAGFSVPTQRSLIMVAVALVGLLCSRRWAATQLLAAAALLILLLDPLAALAPGFWLSFAAVALILYTVTARPREPPWWWRLWRVHLAIALGLVPLLLGYFGQNPWVGPLANLAAVPWVSFIVTPLVLAGAAFAFPLPALASLTLSAAGWALDVLFNWLEFLGAASPALWQPPAPDTGSIAAACVGVALLLLPRGIPGRWTGVVWMLPLLLRPGERPPPGEIELTLLDVGQGLAAVVLTATHAIAFDAGPRYGERFETGSAVVAPHLRALGVGRLDLLVVSHGDNDHAGGAAGLIDALPVLMVLASSPEAVPHPAAVRCREGMQWHWDGVEFRFLNPGGVTGQSDNDASCVLQIRTAGHALLLTGDIEAGVEARLVADFGAGLRADVLIAPHHGSRSSSTPGFIDAVSPRYVLYPVGHANRYGFPHAEVRRRYAERQIVELDTARDGAITLRLGKYIGYPRRERAQARRYWHAD